MISAYPSESATRETPVRAWLTLGIGVFAEPVAAEAAMKLPPAGLLDGPDSDQPHHGLRVTVICVALVAVAAAALTIGFSGLTN